jgi:hypothetical protein
METSDGEAENVKTISLSSSKTAALGHCACADLSMDFEEPCGNEASHTSNTQGIRLDYLQQLFNVLEPHLPRGDMAYFPDAPRAWEDLAWSPDDDNDGDPGVAMKKWFMGAYTDRNAINSRDVAQEVIEEAQALASAGRLREAMSVDASVFHACGPRSLQLVKALRSAFVFCRALDSSTMQVDLFLMAFLNCAKNTLRRLKLEVSPHVHLPSRSPF